MKVARYKRSRFFGVWDKRRRKPRLASACIAKAPGKSSTGIERCPALRHPPFNAGDRRQAYSAISADFRVA